jgi:hypothetical protein
VHLKGAYRVYGIEAARLLFRLEIGTGEPNVKRNTEKGISKERTSEQSNPLCAVFFFLGHLGRIDA